MQKSIMRFGAGKRCANGALMNTLHVLIGGTLPLQTDLHSLAPAPYGGADDASVLGSWPRAGFLR